MKIIILNGVAKSGKDTFADYIGDCARESDIYFEKLSLVDLAKDMLELAGIDRYKKTDKDRKLMSDLNDILTEHSNIPFNSIVNKTHAHVGTGIFTVMVREPKIIQKFKKMYGKHCTTVLIKKDVDNIPNNHADRNVNLYRYDLTIDNNGTYENLNDHAKKLYENIINW